MNSKTINIIWNTSGKSTVGHGAIKRSINQQNVLSIVDHLKKNNSGNVKVFDSLSCMNEFYAPLSEAPSGRINSGGSGAFPPQFYLEYDELKDRLCLMDSSVASAGATNRTMKQPKSICVDFLNPTMQYKIQRSYNAKSALIKAVSVKGKTKQETVIIDGTAGLGGDAYVISTFGFDMIWLEENPYVWAILKDGYSRCHRSFNSDDNSPQQQKPHLMNGHTKFLYCQTVRDVIHTNSTDFAQTNADVVYLDPMFSGESTDKKAAPKKEMQALRGLLHPFDDSRVGIHERAREEEQKLHELIRWACDRAPKVVLKRPKTAPKLDTVHHSFAESDNIRYDVILK